MPRAVAVLYRLFRVADAVMLSVGLAGVLLWLPRSITVVVLVIGVWLFGLLEYLNYFVVRLSYSPRSWLSEVVRQRSPRLVRDLRADRHEPVVTATASPPSSTIQPGP